MKKIAISTFVTRLNNRNVQYHNDSVYLFRQPSLAELIFYCLLIAILGSLAIAVFQTIIRFQWLKYALWIVLGGYCITRLITGINIYIHPKPHITLTPQGIIKDNNAVILWKNLSYASIFDNDSTWVFAFAREVTIKKKDVIFVDNADHTVLQLSVDDLPKDLTPNDLWALLQQFILPDPKTIDEINGSSTSAPKKVGHADGAPFTQKEIERDQKISRQAEILLLANCRHIFSPERVKLGIEKLGKTKVDILKSIRDIVRNFDIYYGLLEGKNLAQTVVNGQKVEVKMYVENDNLTDLDAYPGYTVTAPETAATSAQQAEQEPFMRTMFITPLKVQSSPKSNSTTS